ncbi:carbon storage regulator CsrA [Paenibacillus mucilaginosus]|uniref:Translational regulator CsrA n=2 Tax=Paenibacillus mucilaginosus TaxID=61624 RepID=H6NT75_9BACL|nr:carbon storage regulator CsrA [Paenibacillus mucilaginosus]AEI38756.1 carbon storage regulator, CsrA [Paenibacillus mucilaginosus KNP414]AFC27088.1 carbon storage regulator, CsrA [Paenibacillus mucilaginosus 3016]MCG7215890.1 carbon storage regulator CsrA [Paenibacillus mucilaginosus]WDM27837.1 carbon storage regulator CsrA [Paenibacillus mucilaginosus]WFA16021.1 carbon storage regulator [Paenibacillus mucilaginosus]
MLVLSRKKGESIMIGDGIEVIVLGVEGETVKIGLKAPRQQSILRKEIYLALKESNQEASTAQDGSGNQIDQLKKLLGK